MIGANKLSSLYIDLLRAFAPRRYRVIAVLDDRDGMVGRSIAGVRVLAPSNHLCPVMQGFCNRRDCLRMRGGELAHIDFFSWPSWPHRGERSHDTDIGIKPTQRVGVSTFRATRVKQKIVKVPKNEVVVTLGQAGPHVQRTIS